MTDTETFVLDHTDMTSYWDYGHQCAKANQPLKLFSDWYKEKYGKEIPLKLQTPINKSLVKNILPKWKIAPKEKMKTLVPIDGHPLLLSLPSKD